VAQPGRLFVFVVDEKQFPAPMTGIRSLTLDSTASKDHPARLRFSLRLPAGRFGIRCFLDTNGNGQLDRGLLGPAEPWGMSWSRQRPAGFPGFSDIAFLVDRDMEIPTITIE
jgi:uncharacterized protein (DUF2141 family)